MTSRGDKLSVPPGIDVSPVPGNEYRHGKYMFVETNLVANELKVFQIVTLLPIRQVPCCYRGRLNSTKSDFQDGKVDIPRSERTIFIIDK